MTTPRIASLGTYLPERIMTNADLEKIVDTNNEWIVTRTGIEERRVAADDEYASTMGAHAARQALERASVSPEEVDLIIVATATSDYTFPSTATLIQDQIGARKAAAFDVQAACTGFLYGLSVANAYILGGIYRNILVVATEKLSSFMNYNDRTTCVLFGDGAAAALVRSEGPGLVIKDVSIESDGAHADLIKLPGGGSRNPASVETVEGDMHYLTMNGRETFKHAVRCMGAISQKSLEKQGLTEKDVSWIVPHQANIRIIEAMAKKFSLPMDKVYRTVHKYGNTSASAVAIALEELVQTEEITEGTNILLTAFGSGLTYGAAVLTQHNG